jgi:hypothetical protein
VRDVLALVGYSVSTSRHHPFRMGYVAISEKSDQDADARVRAVQRERSDRIGIDSAELARCYKIWRQ